MNASQKTKETYFNYIGSITLPEDVVKACHHSGPCDDDIDRAMELPEVKAELSLIDKDQLRKELKEYGAWDEIELSDHNENLKRILWIACGDIQENEC